MPHRFLFLVLTSQLSIASFAKFDRDIITHRLQGDDRIQRGNRLQGQHWDHPPHVNIQYHDHPFQRHLQINNDDVEDAMPTSTVENDINDVQPIRIQFLTHPLDSRRGENTVFDADIDFIINQTLPALAQIWTNHLSVYPATTSIEVNDDVCYSAFEGLIGATNYIDADLVVVVGGSNDLRTPDGSIQQVCRSNTLAVASHCLLDQYDRPVVGFINFCLPLVTLHQKPEPLIKDWQEAFLRFETQTDQIGYNALEGHKGIKDTLTIALHEMAHILGMDYRLYKFFRDPETGNPLTPRPFQKRSVTCVDGISKAIEVPSEKVVQWNRTLHGQVYFDIVTPRVATVARNHFGCSELRGARLENQRVGHACFGSHWDERLFLTELMGPVFSGMLDALSPLTLALLEDSGWYTVNYNNATMSPFGRGMGCDFVNKDCIVADSVPAYGEGAFCNKPIQFDEGKISQETIDTGLMCDPSHTSFAICDLFDTPTIPEGFTNIPENPLRYFSNENWVSPFSFGDFCPIPIRKIGIDCQHSHDDYIATFPGEEISPTSRCINGFPNFAASDLIRRPACMQIECDESARKVWIGSGESKQLCHFDGQKIKLDNEGVLECPKASTICPHLFCPSSCSARGSCNWKMKWPKCQCFDKADISDDCSGEYAPTQDPTSTLQPSISPTVSQNPSDWPLISQPSTNPSIVSSTSTSPTYPPSENMKGTEITIMTSETPSSDNPSSDNPTSDSPTSDSPTSDSPSSDSPSSDSPTSYSPTSGSPTPRPSMYSDSSGLSHSPSAKSNSVGELSLSSTSGSSTHAIKLTVLFSVIPLVSII